MFCPKCDKFISSSDTSCKNCGLEIISGYSPNFGRGFELIDNDRGSHNPIREAEEEAELAGINHTNANADDNNDSDTSLTAKLKSFFGFGK